MTDPTTPTPPEGLTDEQLFELAASEIEPFRHWLNRILPGGYEAVNERALEVYGCELLAFARAAIAADRAARPAPPPVPLTPAQLEKLQEVLTDHWDEGPPGEGWASSELDKLRAIVDTWHAQPTPAPAPTPEELEAQFRAWWKASYPNAPVNKASVGYHVAFALHLLRGVQ